MKKIIFILFILSMSYSDGLAQNDLIIQTSKEEYIINDEGNLADFEITVTNKNDKTQIFFHFGHVAMNWLEVKYQDVSFRMLPYVSAEHETFKVNPPEMQKRLIVDKPDYKPHYEGYILNPNEYITFSFGPMLFGKCDKYSKIDATEEMIVVNAIYHYTYMPEKEFPTGKKRKASSNFFRIKCTKKWFLQASKSTSPMISFDKEK